VMTQVHELASQNRDDVLDAPISRGRHGDPGWREHRYPQPASILREVLDAGPALATINAAEEQAEVSQPLAGHGERCLSLSPGSGSSTDWRALRGVRTTFQCVGSPRIASLRSARIRSSRRPHACSGGNVTRPRT
jgi:hypothetical protein